MRKKLVLIFLLLTTVSLACNFLTNPAPSDAASAEAPLPSSQEADGFSAEATDEGSVLLKWEPISGAENYQIEVQIGGEFMPLATLPANQTSYEDGNVPPATRFTYRLSGLAGADKKNSKEISIQTKDEVGDPLQVSPEFDMSAPTLGFDFQNFDPNSIDLENFDPENFDPAMFAPQPIQAEAVIGPQGGEVSVTGSNGVVYTLNVPPDALRFEMTVTLRPISAIPDLPLSGGLIAAVFIEPESLVFDVPATLTMTPPADFPETAGPLVAAFSFETDGQEFHLYPFEAASGQSNAGTHLASLQSVPYFLPPLSEIAKTQYGGGYGQGVGTTEDVKKITSRPPSKPQNQATQQLAARQLDELAPLTPIDDNDPVPLTKLPPEAQLGESILQKVSEANTWSNLLDALDNFDLYMNNGGDKLNVLTAKIIDRLVDNAKKLLEKNKGDCLTLDDYKAQDLVERLTNPKDKTSKLLAEAFKLRHGQKLLDDIANEKKNCSFELTMRSNLTFDTEGSTLITTASVPKIKLFLIYSKGEIYLSGEGKMELKNRVTGTCSYPLEHYSNLTLSIEKLSPVFENGILTDFSLSQYAVKGWKQSVSIGVTEDKRGCPTMVKLSGGGDFWTGLFTVARFTLDSRIVTDWTLKNNLTKGNSLTANWESVVPSFTALGVEGEMSEDTKFKLKVTKTSK